MKTLCISPGYFPAFCFGGPVASVHGLNKALVKKGVEVAVYATNAGLGSNVSADKEADVEGIRATYFSFTKLFEFTGATGWQFSWKMTNALRSELKKYDLVHIHAVWNYPAAAAAHYCMKYEIPYVVAPRGTLYPETIQKYYWKKLPYYHLFVKRFMHSAAAIHYTTQDELEGCHASLCLKNNALVVPNGIDLSEYENLPPKYALKDRYPVLEGKKVILFLGRLNWKKGLDILSKAFGKLAREKKDVHLLVAGPDEGGYLKKVRGWFEEEGVSGQVTFTGMLEGKKKQEALTGSDLFVLPSYSENFGMSVIEAMACGLPVVISNKVGIYREVAGAGAGLVIETDAGQLAEAISNMIFNAEMCKKMGENGFKLVKERFAWDKIAEQMIEDYKKILNVGKETYRGLKQ